MAALVASLITAGQAPRSTIAFVSTRHDTTLTAADAVRLFSAAEIYLMDGDGTQARRLTENATWTRMARIRRRWCGVARLPGHRTGR